MLFEHWRFSNQSTVMRHDYEHTYNGGTGFIGSALVKRLIDQGHAVTVLSRSPIRQLPCGSGVKALTHAAKAKRAIRSSSILPGAGS
jgi:NAD dependent epimerase/dehydratase family enzyme